MEGGREGGVGESRRERGILEVVGQGEMCLIGDRSELSVEFTGIICLESVQRAR